jgi:hypothetical protein
MYFRIETYFVRYVQYSLRLTKTIVLASKIYPTKEYLFSL